MSLPSVEDKVFLESFREHLQAAMVAAAERDIQEAVKKIERVMRAEVANISISMVRGEIDIFRDRNRLCITIQDQK